MKFTISSSVLLAAMLFGDTQGLVTSGSCQNNITTAQNVNASELTGVWYGQWADKHSLDMFKVSDPSCIKTKLRFPHEVKWLAYSLAQGGKN